MLSGTKDKIVSILCEGPVNGHSKLRSCKRDEEKKNLMAVNIYYKTGVFLLSFWAYISYIFICISNFYPLSFAIEQFLY